MRLLKKYAECRDADSLSARLRRKRFALFRRLLGDLPRPARILDVGGTESFWETMGFAGHGDLTIVLLNLSAEPTTRPNFASVAGDSRDLGGFGDGEFDVVFSNSVIEHLGSYRDQVRMAREVHRVGKRYFVQTPNRYFPIEPHFVCPFFQFLPRPFQVFLLQHLRLGTYERLPARQRALEAVAEFRLLTGRELAALFPGAMLWKEKFLGLTKSFVVYKGWESRLEKRASRTTNLKHR